MVGPLLVLTSQALTHHSSETVDKLFTISVETKKGPKVIDKKINELIFVKCLEQSLTQSRHSVFANLKTNVQSSSLTGK